MERALGCPSSSTALYKSCELTSSRCLIWIFQKLSEKNLQQSASRNLLGSVLLVQHQAGWLGFAREHRNPRPPHVNWRDPDSWVPGGDSLWCSSGPWVATGAWQYPVSCGNTSWMLKSLVPSIGPPVILTWIQSNTSGAFCITVATAESQIDWLGADWCPNPGMGRDP